MSTFVESGVPVISGQHLHGFRLEDSEYNFVTPEHADVLKNANVRRGDVIFTHAGSIGQVAYIPQAAKFERYVITTQAWESFLPPTGTPPPVSSEQLSLLNLRELDWLRFEVLTQELFQAEGWIAEKTPNGADGGVDIYLRRSNQGLPCACIQCKAWANQRVGVKELRELYGVMTAMAMKEAYFVTTSHFSDESRAFALGKPLRLLDGESLVIRVNQLAPVAKRRILSAAFAGDYRTPSCPQCGKKMVIRNPLGKAFWGCPAYPRCRSKPIAIRRMKSSR